jgi:hypothetical protein
MAQRQALTLRMVSSSRTCASSGRPYLTRESRTTVVVGGVLPLMMASPFYCWWSCPEGWSPHF